MPSSTAENRRRRDSTSRTPSIKITALSTGTLQLKPSSLIALPTPGYSPGHTGFLVRREKRAVLLAGDVTYDLPALRERRDQGFIADVNKHHHTLRRVMSARSEWRCLPTESRPGIAQSPLKYVP